MAKKSFRPQDLRALLSFILAAIVIGGAALFYFGLGMVRDYALEVNHRLLDADASELQVQQLQTLQNQLAQSESLIAKADKLSTTPEAYQAQSLNDVRNYASQVGLAITATSFNDSSEGGSYGINVKFASPASYSRIIQFLTLVEGNLPKMQVSSLELKHVAGGNADTVEVGDITINVLVR